MTQPKTSFAKGPSPFTGKVPMREVAIPPIVKPRKGSTKYDEEFERLMKLDSAIETTEKGYTVLQRALKRFVQFRGIQGQYSIRRRLDRETRMVTVWLEKK